MSVQRGSTAYLHCRVADLQDQSVIQPLSFHQKYCRNANLNIPIAVESQ
ncbi:hypothetical protein E2C01_084211 [Portunus trituberculatus]|uniref:Uncharacterized protein n=1 Tax=Portunus trituberculatus TaxID=210409 RepID=A0A5B7J471_PORTR|nr:hypothetical protein [Portunus trituberculatus]